MRGFIVTVGLSGVMAHYSIGMDPIEFEQRAVAHRVAIKNYYVSLTHTRHTYTSGVGRPATDCTYKLDVWKFGDKLRVDQSQVGELPTCNKAFFPDGKGGFSQLRSPVRTVHCEGCTPDGRLVTLIQGLTSLYIEDAKAAETKRPHRTIWDPRGLGHDTGHANKDIPVTQGMLALAGVKNTTAEPVRFRDEDAVLVKMGRATGGFEHRCWVVPAKGYSVIRLEAVNTKQTPSRTIVVIDSTVAKDESSGIWFPKRTHWQTFEIEGTGQSPRAEEITEVHATRFNMTQEPPAFSLAGIKATPGTPVFDTKVGASRYWDGQAITDRYSGPIPPELAPLAKSPAEVASPIEPTPDPTRTPVWVYALAAGLAVAGGGLLVLARRFRR